MSDAGVKALNEFLDAKWCLETARIDEQEEANKRLNAIIDQLRDGRPHLSREDIHQATKKAWLDYCRAKKKTGA